MAKLILKSPYIKCGGGAKAGGYIKYIATRENVQLIPDDRPPTRKQEQLIAKLVKDFPDSKELFEYEDYAFAKTKYNASQFISTALEMNWDGISESDVYLRYIATRPRAERFGSHGLFGDDDTVDLEKAMAELDTYTGNVWTHIISLKREDAARLGYDCAAVWRNLLRAHRNEIAEAMQILPNHFRWYAAFHDEGTHPHVHMMAWSSDPKQGYLTRDGIRQIKSKLTNDIFKQELLHTYEQKSISRDELVQEAREALLELTQQMRTGLCEHPDAENLMMELAQSLETVQGKKQYGYLPKPMKALVDRVVDELERVRSVSVCYEKWRALQGEVQNYYTDEQPEFVSLSKCKEFRAIKNAVIQEAERIRLNGLTFEDADEDMAPEGEEHSLVAYWDLKEMINDDSEAFVDRQNAAEELRKLAEDGDMYSQYLLGKLYRDGGLIVTDWVEAKYWFEQAARNKLVAAQYALGKLYLTDDPEVRNAKLGLEWLKYAFKNGSEHAGYRLAKEYLRGELVQKDTVLALNYLQGSAEMGNQYAQYLLGKLLLMGREVKQDRSLAEYWLSQSADQSNQYAQFFLDRIDDLRPPSVLLSATRLLHHLANIFRDNSLPRRSATGPKIDKKRMRKLMEKRQALGQKDAPELEGDQGMQFRGY